MIETDKSFVRKTLLAMYSFFGLLTAIVFSTWYTITSVRPQPTQAFIIHHMDAVNPIVAAGESVKMQLNGSRFKSCPAIIAAFWLDAKGSPVTRFPPITGGYSPLQENYTIYFEVPAPERNTLTEKTVDPGVYHYKSLNAPLCPDLLPTESPDVRICVTVPGKPLPRCASAPRAQW